MCGHLVLMDRIESGQWTAFAEGADIIRCLGYGRAHLLDLLLTFRHNSCFLRLCLVSRCDIFFITWLVMYTKCLNVTHGQCM